MKIVIELDSELYSFIKEKRLMVMDVGEVGNAIKDGIVLPEGHGDLIDRDVACKELSDISFGDDLLRYVPTVIPADNSEVD